MSCKRDAGAAVGRLPAAEDEEFGAVEARNGFDGCGQGGGGGVRVSESADGAVDGDQLEGDLLGDGHHHLLELGLGAERDEPELGAGVLRGQRGGFVKGAGGPGVEDGGQDRARSSAPGRWGW